MELNYWSASLSSTTECYFKTQWEFLKDWIKSDFINTREAEGEEKTEGEKKEGEREGRRERERKA